MIRNCWYAVGFSADFGRQQVEGRTIAGHPIVLWRSAAGSLTALDARCVHKCFPLWDGRLVDGDALECAYHGFTYDQDGRCIAIPALHERGDHIPSTARLRKYSCVEQDGVVWLWPGDDEQRTPAPPRTPEIGSDSWETVSTAPMPVSAPAQLLIENLLDLTHFYPLHAGNLGTYADARVPVTIERPTEKGDWLLRTVRKRDSFEFGPTKQKWFGADTGDNVATHDFVTPGLFRVVERGAPPGMLGTDRQRQFVLYQFITPIDAVSHIWRRSVSAERGRGPEGFAEMVADSLHQTIEEDRWALERQQEMRAHIDSSYREVHIKTDGAVVMARHLLAQLEAAEGQDPARPVSASPRAF